MIVPITAVVIGSLAVVNGFAPFTSMAVRRSSTSIKMADKQQLKLFRKSEIQLMILLKLEKAEPFRYRNTEISVLWLILMLVRQPQLKEFSITLEKPTKLAKSTKELQLWTGWNKSKNVELQSLLPPQLAPGKIAELTSSTRKKTV